MVYVKYNGKYLKDAIGRLKRSTTNPPSGDCCCDTSSSSSGGGITSCCDGITLPTTLYATVTDGGGVITNGVYALTYDGLVGGFSQWSGLTLCENAEEVTLYLICDTFQAGNFSVYFHDPTNFLLYSASCDPFYVTVNDSFVSLCPVNFCSCTAGTYVFNMTISE